MEREGLNFGSWKRSVRAIVEDKVPSALHHFVLDESELRRDYEAGMSVERAAEARVNDAAALG